MFKKGLDNYFLQFRKRGVIKAHPCSPFFPSGFRQLGWGAATPTPVCQAGAKGPCYKQPQEKRHHLPPAGQGAAGTLGTRWIFLLTGKVARAQGRCAPGVERGGPSFSRSFGYHTGRGPRGRTTLFYCSSWCMYTWSFSPKTSF